jgi:hypothetical protein
MADVKPLFRDTPREEYFYRLGFQDGYKAFRALPNEDTVQAQLEAATGHARSQVPPEPEVR